MKYISCFLAILVLTYGSTEENHSSHSDHSKVLKLTKDNYQSSKLNSESIVVLWYGPDRQSQKILSEWPEIIDLLAAKGVHSTTVATSNYEYLKHTAKTDGVNQSPGVVLYFQHGLQKLNYNGYINLPDIASWVQKMLFNPRLPSKPIYNTTQLEERVKTFKEFALFIGYSQESPEFEAYYKMVQRRRDVIFMHTFDKEIRIKFELPENGQAFYIFSKKEEANGLPFITKYQGNISDTNGIKAFIRAIDARGLQMLESHQISEIYKGALPNLILAMEQSYYGEQKEYLEEKLSDLEKIFFNLRYKYVNKVQFKILNMTQTAQDQLSKDFGLGSQQAPLLLLVQPSNQPNQVPMKYVFKGEAITLDSTIQFLEDFKAGKLERVIAKEEPTDPQVQENLLVKSVTYSDWNQLVIESPIDVVVFFYGIGCFDCDEMKPEFYRLAYKMKENKNIRFVRVNNQLNDIPNYPPKKLPQIILFQANLQRSTISLIYQKTAENMIEALKDSVTSPWVEPIPNWKFTPNDIVLDKTPNEIQFEQEQKKLEKEREIKSKKEEEIKRNLKNKQELKKQQDKEEKKQKYPEWDGEEEVQTKVEGSEEKRREKEFSPDL